MERKYQSVYRKQIRKNLIEMNSIQLGGVFTSSLIPPHACFHRLSDSVSIQLSIIVLRYWLLEQFFFCLLHNRSLTRLMARENSMKDFHCKAETKIQLN